MTPSQNTPVVEADREAARYAALGETSAVGKSPTGANDMSIQGLEAKDFIPITDAAKHGRDVLTYAGGTVAVAYWTGDMWAYGGAAREGAPFQLDHEPSRYRELPSRGERQ